MSKKKLKPKVKLKNIVLLSLLLAMLFMTYPVEISLAAGEGSCSVVPGSVIRGSTGNDFTFTFTASGLSITDNMNSGEISITVPSGFSPPQITSSSGNGYVTIDTTNSTGVTADLLTNLNDVSGWSSSDSDLNIGLEGTIAKEGSSLKISVSSEASAGALIYYNFSSPLNWTSYKKVGFWIYTTHSTNSVGDIQFLISENSNLSNSRITLNLPVLNANQWYFLVFRHTRLFFI